MDSLAVRYRPKTFSEVVGQDIILTVLNRQVELKTFKNCYLFCGASGCGKTTVARIFANLINDGYGFPIEIDGASNNGVDNIKSIVASASERSISSTYKVYIIDECHMLTIQAWNAFLKCIEEPPKYTIFIFCTTDPQKIPSTILNRCQRFNFVKLNSSIIFNRLKYICESEHFTNFEDSIDFISKNSNGQLRDAISNLEKVSDYSTDFNSETTSFILGQVSYTVLFKLLNSLIDGRESDVLFSMQELSNSTVDWKYFVDTLINFILEVYKYYLLKNVDCTSIPKYCEQSLISVVTFNDADKYYNYILDKLIKLKEMVKTDNYPYYSVETILLQIARCE